jgi:signal transduction histidine kinase
MPARAGAKFLTVLNVRRRNSMDDASQSIAERLAIAAGEALRREREWLTGILHDHITQTLSAVAIELDLLALDYAQKVPDVAARTAAIQKSLDKAFEQVRALTYDVLPDIVERVGLDASLQRLTARIGGRTLSPVELTLEGPATPEPKHAAAYYTIAELASEDALRRSPRAGVQLRLTNSGMICRDDAPMPADDDAAWLLARTRMETTARTAGLVFSITPFNFSSPSGVSQGTMIEVSFKEASRHAI